MITIIILSIVYVIGFLLCYSMLKMEHEAESEVFTIGDRALNITLSLFSFLIILFMCIKAWVNQPKLKSVWNKPVKQKDE